MRGWSVLTCLRWFELNEMAVRGHSTLTMPIAYCNRFFYPHQEQGYSPMATLELNKENFEQAVANNDIVIVDFWAPWCGPCRSFAPIFDAASAKHADIVFGKVNTEVETELAGYFHVRSIPTLMVFREKVILYSQPGALPASAFEELIGKVREVDMAKVHQEIAEHEGKSSA
jgi:thioredoxin 1